MTDKTFIEKYPEFKEYVQDGQKMIHLNEVRRTLDKYFVRKDVINAYEEVVEAYRKANSGIVKEFNKLTKLIEKELKLK